MRKPKNLYIYMTHGHELRGKYWWEGGAGQRGIKGRKNGTTLVV